MRRPVREAAVAGERGGGMVGADHGRKEHGMASMAPRSNGALDLGGRVRFMMIAGAGLIGIASSIALFRAMTGFAPSYPGAREVAVIIHLAAVLPAIPLGLWVLLTRKGGSRHKLLGRIWMVLMFVTALSAVFIRHINHGGFSLIHLFVPLVIVTMVRAIAAARQGRIAAHRRQVIGMYMGALIVPGLFTFLPGRLMWAWLFG